MSGVISVKFDLFPSALRLMSPSKTQSRLRKEFSRAAFIVGSSTSAKMRKVIAGGVEPSQAKFTEMIKGSTKTLFDIGRMSKAITWLVEKGGGGIPRAIHIGVMRKSKFANVAIIVHKGAKITVTKRMQILFGVLAAITRGKTRKLTSPRAEELASRKSARFVPLREGTEIIIPGRPFAAITFADPSIGARVNREFSKALWRAVMGK